MNLIRKLTLQELARPIGIEAALHDEDSNALQVAVFTATTNYAVDVGTIEPVRSFEEDATVIDTVAQNVAQGLVVLDLAGDAGEEALREAMADYAANWDTTATMKTFDGSEEEDTEEDSVE
ncbi:hypothetical protein BZQ24_08455 [Salmonella enterica subsp. enterica serovar Enteritidis]|nr:hypothetical protein [Salmonella enterica subsp. enterica serovar Enteritidis]